MIKGVYQLLIRLDRSETIRIGRLGTFRFPAGYYIYTGSAMSGLVGRVSRHLRSRKRLRWHVDYLLEKAKVIGVHEIWTDERIECELNRRALSDAHVVAPGFGSSDCRCPSHLIYLGEEAWGTSTFWPSPI
ncbi:TPA: GIY-YIG nuclease family protein [Candidatus Poribacteria bacterium]|nr:GIY-YIG nuclease family protein [Candidatus Poribacteria bacterium]